jgi:hypothetical protein
VGGFRGLPRGVLPGYSDRPFRPVTPLENQPDPELGSNAEARFGARIPEAFGETVRLFPELICPPLVDVASATFRNVERWYCVGAGDYVGDIYLGDDLTTRHPEFPSVASIYRPGELGMPPRRWTNFARAPKGLNLELGTQITSPHRGGLSPSYEVLRPGGGIVIVFRMVSENGFELEGSDTVRGIEVLWRSIENNNFVSEVIDLSETISVTPAGRMKQIVAPFPAGITGPATFRFRLYREHSGVLNVNDIQIQVESFGQRVEESDVTTFEDVTMAYVTAASVPDTRLSEFLSVPLTFVGKRQTREWDATAVRFGFQDSPGRFGDAIVQTLADAERWQSRYLDVSTLAAVQGSMNRVSRDEGLCGLNISDDVSVEEQIRQICDAHRVVPCVVGSLLTFQRDELRSGTALFADRSKLEAEVESVGQRDAAPIDGIAVAYFDREFEVQRSVVYPDDSPEQSVEQLDIPSITSYAAAYRRARFEWLKRQTRRTEIQLQLTEEARHLRPGDRFFLSDSIEDPGTTANGWGVWSSGRLVVHDPDTSVISTLPGSRAVIRGPDGTVYTAAVNSWSVNSFNVVGGPLSDNPPVGYQQALQFILGSEDALNARSFVVATVQDNRDGSVDVSAYSYDASVYAADRTDAPRDPWIDRDPVDAYEDDGDDPDP